MSLRIDKIVPGNLVFHTHPDTDIVSLTTLDTRYIKVAGGNSAANIIIENDYQDGDISFKVNDGGVDKTVMTLDGATGNVGIGTTGPGEKLEVNGNVKAKAVRLGDTGLGAYASGTDSSYIYQSYGVGGAYPFDLVGHLVLQSRSNVNRDIVFVTGATPTVKMVVNNGGNVGIGTTAPLAKLHIDQSSTTLAKPVLIVDQADVSEEFIKFIGTSTTDASQSLIDAADMTTAGALVGWLKIYVQDDQATNPITDGAYYIPFYSAPSA